MPKTLLFATHNKNKSREIAQQVGDMYRIKDLHDLNFTEEIPETGSTLKENALIKARYLHNKTGMACFADDTGLLVEELNNEPGVYSARYAGYKATADENNIKLIANLKGVDNRKAMFKTVIAYVNAHGMEFYFEGEVHGEILTEYQGTRGFGYDPIFKPIGKAQTFAEMSAEEKNEISHRGRAVKRFVEFLQQV